MKTGRNEPNAAWVIDRRMFLKSALVAAGAPSLLSLSCVAGETAAAVRPVRFGIVTDLHYADADPSGTRHYRESLDKLAECVERVQAEKVDFLIELGDFKDQTTPPVEAETLAYLDKIEAVFRKFDGPRYHVLGNHDTDSLSKTQFLEHIENTGIDPQRKHYSFDMHGLHFVVLDANFKADGTEYDHGNFIWNDTDIPASQLEWLKADLAATPGPAIVFVHQLLDGKGPEYVASSEAVRTVLQDSGKVLAVFQGHRHQGSYSQIEGIHYCTQRALIEGSGAENNAYAIVEVQPAGDIAITGYRRAVNRELSAPAAAVVS